MSAVMREHMKGWATRLVTGEQTRDPVEDTADEVWASLLVFADQYLALLHEYEAAGR